MPPRASLSARFPHTSRRRGVGLLVASAVLLAACSTGGSATTAPEATTAIGSTTNPATLAPGATAGATDGTSDKVSANTATQDQLVAALTAAGVPNADRWAREIIEYRPYASDDPALQKLQDNLAKYNPDPATLAGILSALVP